MGLSDVGKTAGKLRDGAHAALGGKNASGLNHKVVTERGTHKVQVFAPDGYIVTGGGWHCPDMRTEDRLLGSYPSDDGGEWIVEMSSPEHMGGSGAPEVTAYAVCVRDDG